MELSNLLVVVGFALIILVLKYLSTRFTNNPEKTKKIYHYQRKQFIMTQAENEFYTTLMGIVGNDYLVFPQVHLSAILDHKVKGQNWRAAFSSINGKSVDYVVCDKTNRKTLLAIELDDSSHSAESRQDRDANVEQMFSEANVPLLRFKDYKNLNTDEIRRQIIGLIH